MPILVDYTDGFQMIGGILMYSATWSRLDNAAKIFPPNTTRDNPRVFRFSCELYETVDPVILQQALDTGLEEFPFYRSIIRRGLFWYYFEKSDLRSLVREEYKPPCAALYNADRKSLLFELTFYRRRINLEIYHALSDGVGALQFLKTIVCLYLLEKHRGLIDESVLHNSDNASDEQRGRDAFDKYYSKGKVQKIPRILRLPRAYRIRGEKFSDSHLGIVEGRVSSAAILQKAHNLHATLGELITSLLICAIHEGMNVRDEEHPVSVAIPVDLRRFFATPSARNFFSVINVSHNFSVEGGNFEDVLTKVKVSFKEQLTQERIHERLNQFLSLEHTLLIKVVPLVVKIPVLKNASWKAEKGTSASFSNIGKITMPRELVSYIHLFNVFNSTQSPCMCVCSFEDSFVISFTSPLVSNEIQRCFFHALGDMGLDIEVISNTVELQEPLHGASDAVLS
jgi:hypothetical protein